MALKSKPKTTEAASPEYFKIGRNIRYRQTGKFLMLKINLETENPPVSQTGKAYLIAQTNRFETLTEIEGELGISLMITKRVNQRKKAARQDDDD